MASYNSFPGPLSGIQMCVIAGGDINDPASDHSCNQRAFSPLDHDPENVPFTDINFSGMMGSPTQSGQQSFQGVMDPGTIVYMLKSAGSATGIILGQSNTIRQSGGGGGQSLMSGKIEELRKQDIGVAGPPKIKEGEKRGAKIREIQESGTMHSLSVLDGLPTHGALFNMSGFRLPELPNIPTATQHNDQMMTQDIMQQLQGAVMSLGSMLQGLMNNGSGGNHGPNSGGGLGNGQSYWDDVHSNLTPDMQAAITSLSNLIQSHETDNGVAYVTGGAVHYGVYLENAVALLSQATNLDDLMNVMSRLQWDTSLFGQDQLDSVVVKIENAWGEGLQEVSSNGHITVTYSNTHIQNTFTQNMTSSNYGGAAGSSSPSSGSGSGSGGGQGAQQIQSMLGNLFGKSAGTIQDMWKRLAPSQEKAATQMHQKLTQEQEAQQQKQINQATTDGGDPLSKNFYVSTGQ